MKRLASTKQAAAYLGIPPRAFARLKMDAGFPKPIGKWHDLKAIEQWLDKRAGNNHESKDWNEIILERLRNNGGVQDALRC